ncbi:hypothetical protein SAMN05192583_1139 [Sphingomonas gellani]|uniref:Uncharacterized protein n=1 Tax=Sphingomonas gellani TaxID=1166340 RepID=A0A1H8B260_9SPHN|nr:hypothetical protein [Sphingomonas gellani]SEM76218.1 hypothetical protein SAMN05192583_1139 [Sphingomonas gellani]
MQSDVNWRAPARLCRRHGFVAYRATEIGRGDLAEMVALALRQPEDQQAELYVSCEAVRRKLPWPRIRELAARADFPTFI